MSNRTEEPNVEEMLEKLRNMKFSGMAEELRLQIEDPNSDLLNFWERFPKLVNAEWTLRQDKKFSRYLKKAHLRFPGACFDETLYLPERQLNVQTVEKLKTCEWIDEGRNLLLTGLTGTGKSYFSNAIAIAALKQYKTVRYYKSSILLKEIDALRMQSEAIKLLEFIEELSKVDLLILDDFGLMELDVIKCRDLFEILDGREGRRSTIVISQIPVKDWYDLFKESTYADACLDRLLAKAYRLDFQGESLRNKKCTD